MPVESAKDPLARAITKREAECRETSERQSFEQLWDLICKYSIPRKAIFYEDSAQGHRKDRYVLDSTAPRSVELFAAFMFSSLNNPATQWIEIALEEDVKATNEEMAWMEMAQKRLQKRLSTSTNIYSNLHENFLDEATIGMSSLLTEGTDRGSIRSSAFHMKNIVVEEGNDGQIDVVYRTQRFNQRLAAQQFPGVDLGRTFAKISRGSGYGAKTRTARFLHCVFPITDEDILSKLNKAQRNQLELKGAQFIGVWVNAEDETVVEVGGYRDMPYSIPRWYTVQGETYARSPAMTVLGDILMVNRMSETTLKGAEKLVDPPLIVPEGGLLSPVRLFPGGITYSDGTVKPEPLIPPGASRIELGGAMIEQRQNAIREGFFVPLFMTPDSPVQTATQVLQQTDERNRAVAPMLIRQHAEHYDRWVPRAFRILNEQGAFGEMPASLQQKARFLRFKYQSPITSSIAQVEGLSVMRAFEGIAPWQQVDEGAFDNVNVDEAVKTILEAAGTPKSLNNSKGQVAAVRKARQQAQEEAVNTERTIAAVEAGAKLQAANK